MENRKLNVKSKFRHSIHNLFADQHRKSNAKIEILRNDLQFKEKRNNKQD